MPSVCRRPPSATTRQVSARTRHRSKRLLIFSVQPPALARDDDASIVVVMKVHELKTEMDRGFTDVDQRFVDVDRRFDDVDHKLEELRQEMEERIRTEGERTRRHFDVVAEQFTGEIRSMVGLLADRFQQTDRRVFEVDSKGTTLYAALDDHELRLRVLERKRRAE